jgi:biotin carboxyl carrier protein
MKLFNEIEAPFKCKIVKILIDDATMVTKDQPIMAIEKL